MRHLLEEASGALDRFARLRRALLLLDFDGTLAPFAPTPHAARLDPIAAIALDRLLAVAGSDLSVGVASGRRIEDLRRLLPPLHVWIGLHGLELAIGDEPRRLRFDPALSDRALERLRPRLDAAIGAGGRIEDKVHSIALHVRGLEPARAATAIAAFMREVERERGAPLECVSGHMVVEARPLGAGKHRAIGDILRTLGAGGLAFVGDDLTDEEVFRAFPDHLTVAVMDAPRTSDAAYYLRTPRETAAMLRAIAARRASRLGRRSSPRQPASLTAGEPA
jgi:trehalose-phosphatase